MKPLNILVTAGPTREPIDPVRFISNYSTGAMGYAIAQTAQLKRHKVTLVTGPAALSPPKHVRTIHIVTAKEMFDAVSRCFDRVDCVIMAAAVSDFRPTRYSAQKIKRANRNPALALRNNRDILAWLGRRKGEKLLIGFCMETSQLVKRAKEKMRLKNADIMVANRIDPQTRVFGPGRTTVHIVGPDRQELEVRNADKPKVAAIILEKTEQLWYNRHSEKQKKQGVVAKW